MKGASTIVIALVAVFLGASCSHGESRAASPKTASKPSSNPAPPPAPDASAATRKPGETLNQAPPPGIAPAEAPRDPGHDSGADERLLSDEDAAIPTQEEANREAEQAITEENADQELEKLEAELGGGGG